MKIMMKVDHNFTQCSTCDVLSRCNKCAKISHHTDEFAADECASHRTL